MELMLLIMASKSGSSFSINQNIEFFLKSTLLQKATRRIFRRAAFFKITP